MVTRPIDPEDVQVGGKEARIPALPLLVGTTNGTRQSDPRGGAVVAEEGDGREGGGAPSPLDRETRMNTKRPAALRVIIKVIRADSSGPTYG